MKRIIIAILIGLISAEVIGIMIVNRLPTLIVIYSPIIIGGLVSGLLSKKRVLAIGIVMPLALIILSFVNLTFIVSSTSKSFNLPVITVKMITEYIIYIPCGFIGVYLGYFLRKKGTKRGDA